MTNTLTALVAAGDLAQNAASGKKGFPTGEGYIAEPKHDGWRILAHIREDAVDFYSRTGKTYNDKLPKVEAELLAHFPAGTWLDGEAVAIRVEGGKVFNDWGTAQSVLSKVGGHAAADKVSYMVFDLLAHGDIDARPLALIDRRGLLERIFEDEDFEAVLLSPIMEATDENVAALIEAGYEGAVIKRLDRRYASGKREGAGWTKVKPQTTIDVIVTGFKPGENGFTGMVGAVEFGQWDGEKIVPRGRCSGMDMRTRLDMTKNADKWLGKVIEIAHMGAMADGLRHPQFKRLRDDKLPEQAVIDNG